MKKQTKNISKRWRQNYWDIPQTTVRVRNLFIGVPVMLAAYYLIMKLMFISQHHVSSGMLASFDFCPAGGSQTGFPCPSPIETILDYVSVVVVLLGLLMTIAIVIILTQMKIEKNLRDKKKARKKS